MAEEIRNMLNTLFPVSFRIQPDMTVDSASPLIRDWAENINGSNLKDVWQFQLPREADTFEQIQAYEKRMVLVLLRGHSLAAKGQFITLEASDAVLFVGVPWLSWILSTHPSVELKTTMFPPFDSQLDHEFLISTQTAMLQDTDKLSEELAQQRRSAEVAQLENTEILKQIASDLEAFIQKIERPARDTECDEDGRLVSAVNASGIRAYIKAIELFSSGSGSHQTSITPVELRPLISSVTTTLKECCLGQKMLSTSISAEVPQMITADPVKLRRILLIITNFALSRSRSVEIRTSAPQEFIAEYPEYVIFEISDDGAAIPGHVSHDLFEGFSAQSLSNLEVLKPQLAACKTAVESLGGTLGLSSTQPCGNTVSIQLPFTPVTPARSEATAVQSPSQQAQAGMTPNLFGRALVISRSRKGSVLAGQLVEADIDVKYAESVEEGLYFTRRSHFSCVLLDLDLPCSELQDFSNHFNQQQYGSALVALGAEGMTTAALQDIQLKFDATIINTGDGNALPDELRQWL